MSVDIDLMTSKSMMTWKDRLMFVGGIFRGDSMRMGRIEDGQDSGIVVAGGVKSAAVAFVAGVEGTKNSSCNRLKSLR